MRICVKLMGYGLISLSFIIMDVRELIAKQLIDFNNNSCHSATREYERASAIPGNLLTSISLAETGRWDPKKAEMFAWPWTVTAGGTGKYYPSKQKAVEAVKELQSRGVKNIDVGCMQINLKYHPNAFSSLDQAFDPLVNVDYARKFLSGLHRSTGSWVQAAANYHSTNPQLNLNYRTKVLRIWREVSGVSLSDLPIHPSPNPAYSDPETRIAQMTLLNSRFRARLDAERGRKKQTKTRDQLQEWREARTLPNLLPHTAALQRAKMLRRQKLELKNLKTSFTQKRRRQLAKWRKDPYSAFR